jgi:hypothetical protein
MMSAKQESRFEHLFNDHQTEEETRALIEQCAREMYGIQADKEPTVEKAQANDAEGLEL